MRNDGILGLGVININNNTQIFAAIADVFSYGSLMNSIHISMILYNFCIFKMWTKISFHIQNDQSKVFSSMGLQRPVIVWMEYRYLGMEHINFNNRIIKLQTSERLGC